MTADIEDFELKAMLGLRDDLALALRAVAHHASPRASETTSASSSPTKLERLCRYFTRTVIANERQLWRNSDVSCGSTGEFRRFLSGSRMDASQTGLSPLPYPTKPARAQPYQLRAWRAV